MCGKDVVTAVRRNKGLIVALVAAAKLAQGIRLL